MIRFSIALILILFLGCKRDPEPLIPSYLRLEPFEVVGGGGAPFHKLPYAYVYINNEFRGGYPVPGVVPYLGEGDLIELEVFPAIKENGSVLSPSLYKVMEQYKTRITLKRDSTTTITPVTKYFPNVVLAQNGQEDFDGSNTLPYEDIDGDSLNTLVIGSAGGFMGRYGSLTVDTAHARNGIGFREAIEGLPLTGGRPVYLELHYKCDHPFQVLLKGSNATGSNTEIIPIFEFNRINSWNKIYINITSFLSSTRYPKYSIQFRMALERDLSSGKYVQDKGTAFFDNIRVVYF